MSDKAKVAKVEKLVAEYIAAVIRNDDADFLGAKWVEIRKVMDSIKNIDAQTARLRAEMGL